MKPQDRGLAMETRGGSIRTLIYGALRIILVPAVLIWTLSQITGTTWFSADLSNSSALVLGILVNQVALCVFAARMQLVLRLFQVRLGWVSALRIHLQSMFYFFVLPMTVGVEIVRFFKIRQIHPSSTVVQLSSALLIDRLLGAGSALAIAIACLPFVSVEMSLSVPGWVWFAGGGLFVIMAVWLLLRVGSRRSTVYAWRLVHARWSSLGALFALSILMHILFAAGIQVAGNGLGLRLKLVDTIFALGGGMLLLAVPVSFAGLGLAEVGVAGLFMALGYPPVVALTAGALPYLARLIGAVEGGLWELIESGSATIAAARRLTAERQ
jgi:uncharacterized membrane protein YbhN (UPF0104 family)